MLQYGINDCTVPPVPIISCFIEYAGSVGRPRLLMAVFMKLWIYLETGIEGYARE